LKALRTVHIESLAEKFPVQMLWVSLLGAIASSQPDQAFFLDLISAICHENHIQTSSQAIELLAQMPVLERTFMNKCHDLLRAMAVNGNGTDLS
jgi:hypothetical protein